MPAISEEARAGRGVRLRLLWALFGVALLIAVALAFLVLPGDPREAPTDKATATTTASSTAAARAGSIANFSGTGAETSTAFSAAANWEIRWRAEANSGFTIELLDKDGASRGQVVAGKKQSKGSSFVSEEGEFKLKVAAGGDWSVEIMGRPDKK